VLSTGKRVSAAAQLLANIGVIALCLLVGWLAVKKSGAWTGAPDLSGRPPVYRTGDAIDAVAGVDFKAARRTLVMVVREDCRYCAESLPFYQKLTEARAKNPGQDLRVIVATTDAHETLAAYLRSNRVDVDKVVTIAAGALKVPGTPSLLLVDATGRILSFWRGKLPPQQEQEVLRVLGLTSSE